MPTTTSPCACGESTVLRGWRLLLLLPTMQRKLSPLSLSSPTFTVRAATNFLTQPSQTDRMEAWQKCVESAFTLAAPTQPQGDPCPLAQVIAKALPARLCQIWRLPWEKAWKEVWWCLLQHGVVGAGGHGWPVKQGTACPCDWQHATASRRATQDLQLRERFWDLHKSSGHQVGHTTQPPRGIAAAATCVASRTALPISEKGSVVCCLLSSLNCYYKI